MQRKGTTLLALAAAALTLSVLWYLNRPIIVKEATWEDVKAEAQSGGYRLITTEELAQRYRQDAGKLLLVDTRQDWEYRTGHMKGAVNFPIEPSAWGRWRSQGASGQVSGTRQGPAHRFLLSGLSLSPQRLGGPGGRKARLQKRLSRSLGVPGMAKARGCPWPAIPWGCAITHRRPMPPACFPVGPWSGPCWASSWAAWRST